jgi:hypothetical protein
MKLVILCLIISLRAISIFSQPVFKNPGLPASQTSEISEYFDAKVKYITTTISITQKERSGLKYYYIVVNEGNLFKTEIEVNYNDLTTISEKRVDLSDNSLDEYFTHYNNLVHFFNKTAKVNLNAQTNDKNIYSRFAYFISFAGFPFEKQKSVTFKTYISEYGDALTMKATNLGKQNTLVKSGNLECYKIELSVGGWQSMFAKEISYLYFTVAIPHNFVKYEEKDEDGVWHADELVRIY